MIPRLIKYRYELFLVSQLAVLFGELLTPDFLRGTSSQTLYYINVLAGSLFIGLHKSYQGKLFALISLIGGLMVIYPLVFNEPLFIGYLKFILVFIFYSVVTYQIIKQVWNANEVNKTVIFGMMSGYISLGFLGFFIFLSQELLNPNSFSGLLIAGDMANNLTERLMYYSYITLMTIGYGEITPITPLAQKATILVGLLGQFYLVIITAIIVGKFISQKVKK